jgi:cytochrome P450
MGSVLFGQAWSDNENGDKIIKTHRFLIEGSATLGLSCCEKPTWENFMKLPGDYSSYQAAIKEFHRLCWSMIEQRRKEVAENPGKWASEKSALTLLVTEKDEKGKPFFDKILAISTCAGFLNGAYDTTHCTTFWLMYNLATHQEAQEALIREVDENFPNKKAPTFDGCREMKRLFATIQESIRLCQTVPLGMRGNYREDTKIGDTIVPKAATMLPFTNGAHRNPKFSAQYFGADVDKFRPERFMGDGPEAKKACKAFHGWGSGNRMCVGFKFAETELRVMFTFFLQRYTIHLADPSGPEPEMIFESGCQAPKNKNVCFVFKPRK